MRVVDVGVAHVHNSRPEEKTNAVDRQEEFSKHFEEPRKIFRRGRDGLQEKAGGKRGWL
jgi:hypothetical protein